jgi:tryptophan-rich sensory protein
MATLYYRANNKSTVVLLFSIQWILNVAWNPVFFYFQAVAIGLITISFLTVLIGYFLFKFRKTMSVASWLIVPYFIWLLIATSLNAYILLYN